MNYELMQESHLEEIVKLQQEWDSENITYGFVAGTYQQIAEALTQYCFIVRDGEKIIGYLMAELQQDNEFCVFPKGASYVEVYDLYIAKDYRSCGYGNELLKQCENEARKNGIKHIYLSSATKDAEAVRNFYTSSEYTIWATQFFKNLEETLL